MYQKILVAMDLSPMYERVFQVGLTTARHHQATMILVHVLSPEEDNSPMPIPPDISDMYPAFGNDLTLSDWQAQWKAFERQGKDILHSLAERAKASGVKVEYHQLAGSPGKMICDMAQEWQVDLIIIGRRGRSGLSEMLLGSVSNYVLHHSHCCNLIVQS